MMSRLIDAVEFVAFGIIKLYLIPVAFVCWLFEGRDEDQWDDRL